MFNTEKELVDSFVVHESKKKNTKIFVELETNYGRPDIVVVKYHPHIIEKRIEKKYDSPFSRIHSYALTFLYNKRWIRTEKLRDFLNVNDNQISKIVINLENRGLIEKRSHLIKIKKNEDILAIKSIKCVEAKLTNWKYVIEQAERHLWFTNESLVLLPTLSEDILFKCEELCKKTGVNLIVSGNKEITTKVYTNNKKLINTPLLWEINERLIKELEK
ncbi:MULTISPECIES: hypothetical protein [unclassified Exiguobacterium]|uniref:hypothetical protein n=1 Tax=unclassified Exiguobacterium TaxID=2644629 RepID=UPI001BEC8BC7|nr:MULTISPECIES: hypothetical protein [unclassified Exiguobacterium]